MRQSLWDGHGIWIKAGTGVGAGGLQLPLPFSAIHLAMQQKKEQKTITNSPSFVRLLTINKMVNLEGDYLKMKVAAAVAEFPKKLAQAHQQKH